MMIVRFFDAINRFVCPGRKAAKKIGKLLFQGPSRSTKQHQPPHQYTTPFIFPDLSMGVVSWIDPHKPHHSQELIFGKFASPS
jgi:hypothetical protein